MVHGRVETLNFISLILIQAKLNFVSVIDAYASTLLHYYVL